MGFWVFFSDDRVEYYDSDACALYLSPDRTIEIVDNSKIIFDFMIEHRNVAIYRDQIIAQIDGTGDSQSYNNKRADRGPVDQAIRVLRVKLDKYADCIRTVRGVGYKYVGPPKEDKQLPTSQPNTSNPPPFDAESGVKKEAERNTQIASHSSQHGAMNGSPHTSNGTSVSISIEAAIKRARISKELQNRELAAKRNSPFLFGARMYKTFLENYKLSTYSEPRILVEIQRIKV